jgi:hypothetical protein
MNLSRTLSTTGNSEAVYCDTTTGGPVGVTVIGATASSFAYTIQFTMDDIMTVPSTGVTWTSDAAATELTEPSSVVFEYQGIQAVRFASSSVSSSPIVMSAAAPQQPRIVCAGPFGRQKRRRCS